MQAHRVTQSRSAGMSATHKHPVRNQSPEALQSGHHRHTLALEIERCLLQMHRRLTRRAIRIRRPTIRVTPPTDRAATTTSPHIADRARTILTRPIRATIAMAVQAMDRPSAVTGSVETLISATTTTVDRGRVAALDS